ncbi:hypothetical protein, partial [Enterococcus faecium]|uniref:hypothetical protein n=1 Tax=Enterococcus faecium TaxID=1352 RepID=UPI000BCFDBE2
QAENYQTKRTYAKSRFKPAFCSIIERRFNHECLFQHKHKQKTTKQNVPMQKVGLNRLFALLLRGDSTMSA